jgi:lipoprotein-anchoring transpeptidase ErfK/SrfK
MKLRTVLAITLVLTAINGGMAIYWYLQPLPPPTAINHASVEKIASPLPKPPDPQPPPKSVPDKIAILQKPLRPKIPDASLPANRIANWILVEKKARRLTLFHDNTPIKIYDIALGRQPEGPKQFEGDNRTPEGRYIIDSRNRNSSYHRALRISYPNRKDSAFAARQKRPAGGSIMIHGLPNGMGSLGPLHRLRDWTAGCIAVTNTEIEEIWRAVPNGTPIEIRP